MKNFRDLHVWTKAHAVTLSLYRLTGRFPKDELFGLTSQIRRSAASIGANIAEGCGRSGNAEFHRFLQIASGSASELEYHLLLARDLGYVKTDDYDESSTAVEEIKKMLSSLARRVDFERSRSACRAGK